MRHGNNWGHQSEQGACKNERTFQIAIAKAQNRN
jgi:hypothetical protein